MRADVTSTCCSALLVPFASGLSTGPAVKTVSPRTRRRPGKVPRSRPTAMAANPLAVLAARWLCHTRSAGTPPLSTGRCCSWAGT